MTEILDRPGQGSKAELTPEMRAKAQQIFDYWWDRWSDVHDLNGGQGDTDQLFTALWDCWKKAR